MNKLDSALVTAALRAAGGGRGDVYFLGPGYAFASGIHDRYRG